MALAVIFGLILQATVLAELNLFGIGLKPDLPLIVVVSIGLLKGPWYGAVVGLAAGLTADLRIGGVLGVGALSRMVTGFGAGLLEKLIFKDNLLVPVLALSAGTILNESIYLLVYNTLGWQLGSPLYFVPRVLSIAVYNALLAPLVYRRLYRLEMKLASA